MAKRSTVRVTKRVVDDLQPGQDAWDSEVKGFGVRCQGQGKSYVLKKTVQGRQCWITIGRHGSPWTPDTARVEALKLLGQIVAGMNPKEVKSIERLKIEALCDQYLEKYAEPKKKPSSVRLDRKNIQNHVKPLLGQRFVDELKAADIEAFKHSVRHGKMAPSDKKAQQKSQKGGRVVTGGPVTANNCLKLLSVMFNQAELWGYRPKASNPVKGITRFREVPKERFLNAVEFKRLGDVLSVFERDDKESIYAIAAVRLLIMTGARLSVTLPPICPRS